MINELGRNFFWSLLTELAFVILAVLLRENKRRMILVLSIGTFIAGVIGFGPKLLSLPNMNAQLVTSTSAPSAKTEAILTSVEDCPNALPSKLQIGDKAEVVYFQLSGRLMPGFNSPVEHVLAQGQVVEAIEGPRCADDSWWWKIHFAGIVSTGDYFDYMAWMPEVDYDTYYLKHVP
jgi:hypothetical protein